jgi:hypothetical protein
MAEQQLVDPAANPAPDAPAADTAATAAPAAPATLATAADPAPDPKAAPDTPAADWRDDFAGQNKDLRKLLGRYSSQEAFGKAHIALQQKISSGELRAAPAPYPEKGTDDEKAAWRKDNGVPDAADKYEVKLEGVVFGDADKPGLDRLSAFAHAKNWTNDQYNAVLDAYHHEVEARNAAMDQADAQFRTEAENDLRATWKGEYQTNLAAMKNFMAATMPTETAQTLMASRTPDGRLLGDNPAILKWLTQVARDANPEATLLPPSGVEWKGAEAELEGIRKMRRENPDAYDADKKLQAREVELIAATQAKAARGQNRAA